MLHADNRCEKCQYKAHAADAGNCKLMLFNLQLLWALVNKASTSNYNSTFGSKKFGK